MRTMAWLIPVLVLGTVGRWSALAAQEKEEGNQAALAKAVMSAKVSLAAGLAASAKQGQPISGKFETEEGHLQLSVYTAKDGKFSEVIVDHTTGKVEKSEAITEGEDLSAAKEQQAAMAKAKRSLREAVARALQENAGFRAVSVTPSLKDGRAVATLMLVKGEELKTVSLPLQ